ncbi:hypothetical protein, conserved [Trypanosoma brucei brucei TREU927]|uniref:TFIIH basal transcription factor subunit n=1 Tax=Trypanosoma brucei brucei (strain 927/4 GUTat10.1) TaxID=185431 RepID=Q381H9_TRYB2|nr:hypothetical protein, conserved [Trypanosoma brucei brucei TREU927]EAN80552.1 hypothetical protein, conserved [Trypanosoma brucei brucei TREU927]
MPSYIFILHSSGVSCDSALLSQAAHCASALFSSVRGCSSDFVPTVAVIRANPVEGVRYAYTSTVSDNRYDSFVEDAVMQYSGNVNEADGSDRASPRFSGRSVVNLQRAILQCGDIRVSDKQDAEPVGVWRCLAGAILAACCFLRSYSTCPSESFDECGAEVCDAFVPAGVAMIIFSGVCDTRPLSFSEECPFSAAVTAATRLRTAVHVFGPAVVSSALGLRLQALANTTGGIWAPQFALSHVGYLMELAVRRNGQREMDSATNSRRQRELLVERYVVPPACLPQDPAQTGVASGENVSYLAWLCSACLATLVRHPHEEVGAIRMCPYCAASK